MRGLYEEVVYRVYFINLLHTGEKGGIRDRMLGSQKDQMGYASMSYHYPQKAKVGDI